MQEPALSGRGAWQNKILRVTMWGRSRSAALMSGFTYPDQPECDSSAVAHDLAHGLYDHSRGCTPGLTCGCEPGEELAEYGVKDGPVLGRAVAVIRGVGVTDIMEGDREPATAVRRS